jgi:TolB-like protein
MSANRKLVVFMAAIVLFLSGSSSCALAQDMRPTAAALAAKIAASGRKTVAVVDFTDLQGCVTELGRFMAEDISVALLENAKGFDVIDRTNLKILMQEHKLASTGIIDPATARKLGQVAGVDALITGTISPLSDSVHVSAKVLDAESAKMLGGVTAEIPRTRAVDELLAKGVANCGNSSTESLGGSQIPGGGAEASQKPGQHAGQDIAKSSSIEIQQFLFSFRDCLRSEDSVECSGTVTNRGERDQGINIWTSDRTYLVDDTGQQSKAVTARLGAGDQNLSRLPPGVPLNFSLFVRGLSSTAASVSIYLVTSRGSGNLNGFKLHDK